MSNIKKNLISFPYLGRNIFEDGGIMSEEDQRKKKLDTATGILAGAGLLAGSGFEYANVDTSGVENQVEAELNLMKKNQQSVQANSLDDLMNQWSSWKKLDTNYNSDDYYVGPSNGQIVGNTFSTALEGASAGLSVGGPWGALVGGIVGTASGLTGSLLGRKKARNAANNAAAELRAEATRQNSYKKAAFQTAAENLTAKNNRMLSSQIAAYGGQLGIGLSPVGGAIDYMQNEELLSSIADKTSSNSKKVSMPIFAFGGALGGYGGDWSNGLNFIKAGGTHGENPIGGVPMGIAQDGMPNLVEEGEVVWNDYVFSNRLNVPKKLVERLGLKGDNTMTFAEAVERAQKTAAERPNDPIEKRGLEATLSALMQEQESIRQAKAEKEQFNESEERAAFAADGGPIHISKNKRGTFTAAATRHGMGVQEFANHVLANTDKYSTTMIQKANFARNANKWNHALGGYLFATGGPRGIYPFDEEYQMEEPNYVYTKNGRIDLNNTGDDFYETLSEGQYLPITTDVLTFNQITTPTTPSEDRGKDLPTSGWQTALRYAPMIGSALSLGHTLFNRPDYKYANELEKAAEQYASNTTKVSPTLLGDYLAYNPFDRLFYANELGAQQAANRRAIMNASNGNAGQAMAALLASGYNDNVGLGKLFREGEEYNLAQRQKVAEFNRGTNQYNSNADLQAQMFNAQQDRAKASMLLDAKMRALGMKQNEDLAYNQSIAANLTGLFDNLGAVGNEAVQRYWLNALINSGAFGTPNSDMINSQGYSKGGKLKKKKGITI